MAPTTVLLDAESTRSIASHILGCYEGYEYQIPHPLTGSKQETFMAFDDACHLNRWLTANRPHHR